MIYYANPTTAAVQEAMDAGLLGCITTVAGGAPPRAPWDTVADNGCFSSAWEPDRWLRWLEGLPRNLVRWAAAPDVVDLSGRHTHAATLERWHRWAPAIRELGHVPAFVCQPGCTLETVPPDAEVLFLGGTTEWKLGPDAWRIAAHAGERWVHMGRVNSLRRLRSAVSMGCDSADGTYLAFGPDKNLPRLLRWLAEVNAQPALELAP